MICPQCKEMKGVTIKNLLKQFGINAPVRENNLIYNGKNYDSHEALNLLKNAPFCNNNEIDVECTGNFPQTLVNFQKISIFCKRQRKFGDSLSKGTKLPRIQIL